MPVSSIYEFCQKQELLRELGAEIYAKFRRFERAHEGCPECEQVRKEGTAVLRLNQQVLLARTEEELADIERRFSSAKQYIAAIQ